MKNVASRGETIQGGSTITMQLVRALYISDERTFERKIREAKLAEELENEHTKEWILETYLNAVPYGTVGGQTALGAGAAARVYFNKRVQDLKLHEAAMLAGLPQGPPPTRPCARPRPQPPTQRGARQDGRPRDDQARDGAPGDGPQARAALGKYVTKRREQFFFDYVKDELVKEYGPRRVQQGGLRSTRRSTRQAGGRARGDQPPPREHRPVERHRHARQQDGRDRGDAPRPTTRSSSTTSRRRASASRDRRSRSWP
jgi:penicillin-binding protein 1A